MVMEDTSDQQQYVKDLENLNHCDQNEPNGVFGEVHRKPIAELRKVWKELRRQKVQMVEDFRKDVEYMKQRTAMKRMERRWEKELDETELARQSARNDDRLAPRPIPPSRSQENATQSNNNMPVNMEKMAILPGTSRGPTSAT